MIDRKPQGSACASLESGFACEHDKVLQRDVVPSLDHHRRSAGQVLAWVGFGPPEASWGRTQAPLSSNVPTFGHRCRVPSSIMGNNPN